VKGKKKKWERRSEEKNEGKERKGEARQWEFMREEGRKEKNKVSPATISAKVGEATSF
jgi:hypothetical protein